MWIKKTTDLGAPRPTQSHLCDSWLYDSKAKEYWIIDTYSELSRGARSIINDWVKEKHKKKR